MQYIRARVVSALALAFCIPAIAEQPHPLPIPNACGQVTGGPPPCKDSDGDGFCDSWEHAQRIPGGPLLPDADPNKPDIYVRYDWMDYGLAHDWCATAFDCSADYGPGHEGESCGAENTPYEGVCYYPCTTDNECTSRSPADVHRAEKCVNNACLHTHDPAVVDPGALEAVQARFAAHGINLHILRGVPLPHSDILSFRRDDEMDISCEGGSTTAQNVGPGKYAVSFYDFKPEDVSLQAYHYAVFAHHFGCDSPVHCPATASQISTCSDRTLSYGASGESELNGDDFVVSLGRLVNDVTYSPHVLLPVAFMHELGHNLGLRHDGHLDRSCNSDGDCAAGDQCIDIGDGEGRACREPNGGEPNYKPNYLSIMNYRYTFGIETASVIGSRVPTQCYTDADCGRDGGICARRIVPGTKICSMSAFVCDADADCNDGESCILQNAPGTCARLDFSRQTLPVGGPTPGALNETNLDDASGLGSGTTDIFLYTDSLCHFCPIAAPSTGPVNWAGTGLFTTPLCRLFRRGTESFTDTGVQADVDANGACVTPVDVLHGHTDWPDLSGVPFNYKFQCVNGVFDRRVGRANESTAQ